MKRKQNKSQVIKTKYLWKNAYIALLNNIIIAPVILLVLYENLAGGLLNGLAGYWREYIVAPDVFLLFINPVVLLSTYFLVIVSCRNYLSRKIPLATRLLIICLIVISTLVTAIGTFWKVITT